MSDIAYWIWFSSLRGMRFAHRRALLEQFGGPKEVFIAARRDLAACGLTDDELALFADRRTEGAERILSRCGELGYDILTMQDALFPERLKNISDPPYVLYLRGRLPAVDCEAAIAVVGTRRSSVYGDKMARNMGYGIAKGGGIVVTGLAGGIDSRAAEGALLAGGTVIGVLGTAINEVYPSYNGPLYDDVAASGALVSEYPPDAEGSRDHFPARNRIMAGLTLGTVVVEAPFRSGALITAHRALDYGRDVFAVPGNADAPNSCGSNGLLREGARIAETAWDVLGEYEDLFPDKLNKNAPLAVPEEMNIPTALEKKEKAAEAVKAEKDEPGKGFFRLRVPVRKKKAAAAEPGDTVLGEQLAGMNENQLKIVGVMSGPSMHVDDIIDLTGLPAATVLSELTILQIKGAVTQESGKRFTLNITKRG